jgi:hypothetical protein
MNMPGFNAEFALSTAGRGYRQTVNALTNGSRASVLEGAMIGLETCVLDSTLTVEEAGGTSTINTYKCTVDLGGGGGGGGGGQVPSGPNGGGGGGGGGGTEPPRRKCRPPLGRVEVAGVLWRNQCPSEQITSCCQKKAETCREACRSRTPDCKNECDASGRVCKDERNPRGPVVCSLP